MISVKAQFNPNTGKAIYNPITGKVQVIGNDCEWCTVTPRTLRIVLCDFVGCLYNCPGVWCNGHVLSLNGEYDIPQERGVFMDNCEWGYNTRFDGDFGLFWELGNPVPIPIVWLVIRVHACSDVLNKIWIYAGTAGQTFLNDVNILTGDGTGYEFTTGESDATLLGFKSGSDEPDVGDVLEGVTSGATGTFVSVSLTEGAWGDGDATGIMKLSDIVGDWEYEEIIKNNTQVDNDIATVNQGQSDCAAWGPTGFDIACTGAFSLNSAESGKVQSIRL